MFLGFFFQAEDGIRDLVRSRGLGDVYKRQIMEDGNALEIAAASEKLGFNNLRRSGLKKVMQGAVSYTHLTLPTSDLV